MSSKIRKIINKIKNDIEKEKYLNNYQMMNDVKQFIIKKKLLLYGGYALNLLLPEKYQFYSKDSIQDYDCYSKNAKKDAYELANILNDKGYQFIQVRKAMHENTYKVYANFIQIIDITLLNEDLFDKYYKLTLDERKTSIYKNYKESKLYILPYFLLKRNIYFELSRPKGSSYRWEKIYKRLKIIDKILLKSKKKISYIHHIDFTNEQKEFLKILLSFIKKYKNPIIGSYTLKYYDSKITKELIVSYSYGENNSNITSIISKDIIETTKQLVQYFKNKVDNNIYEIIVDNQEYEMQNIVNYKINKIYIKNKKTNYKINITNIINLGEFECYSINNFKGLKIGTIFTSLYYLYTLKLIFEIIQKDKIAITIINEVIYIFEKLLNKININKLFTINCYGNNIPKEEIIKNNWRKKKTIYYPKKKLSKSKSKTNTKTKTN